MIYINSKRECFFDDFLIDKEKTSAQFLLHHPLPKEIIFKHDAKWEGDGCTYHNFFYDEEEKIYRMYYEAWMMEPVVNGTADEYSNGKTCYAESRDGINWTKPNLGICSCNGSYENNVILDTKSVDLIEGFYVFKDKNPKCPSNEKYKGIMKDGNSLCAFLSPDGIHFEKGNEITNLGAFDSLNIIFWDEKDKIYRGFIRGFHVPGDFYGKDPFDNRPLEISDEERNVRVRDIRYIESKDFKTWTTPKLLQFGNGQDMPFYTNCISRYGRDTDIFVGFPTRYIERQEWTKSFDELCSKENRLKYMQYSKRFGLAITDCIFMVSRDGLNFKRYDEALVRPGAEFKNNWVYGSCYPAVGFLNTKSDVKDDCDEEISMFISENSWTGEPKVLRRYTIRQDGFVSLHAGGKEEVVTTKPFVFDGCKMYANISTSAAGYMYFELTSKDGKTVKSCEMFGDSIDKLIGFDEDLKELSGKEVVLTVRMMDADLYSIKFEK